MSREAHVRICEGLRVRLPWATRLFTPTVPTFSRLGVHNLATLKHILQADSSSVVKHAGTGVYTKCTYDVR